MAEYRELHLMVEDGIGSCVCPFCETVNMVGFRKVGKYHLIASCEHMDSIRYGHIGESKEKGYFARFENPQPKGGE